MKGRDVLREMLGAGKPKVPDVPAMPLTSGPVKAVNLGLQALSDEAAAAKMLRATLASGEKIVEIDPASIDTSFVIDRIPADADPDFERLKNAMLVHGQQVPILVRPHPDSPKRYQAAYGHRRLRAAQELGRPIKAIIRSLTDAELVVAQGQENNERRDLSFIERAQFASNLDQRRFDRDTIAAALGVDKPELSRLLSAANTLGTKLIMAIGPAPKVGRPRWLLLAGNMTGPDAKEAALCALETDAFRKAETNVQFNIILAAVQNSKNTIQSSRNPLNTPSGRRVAWIERTRKGLRLVIDELAFVSFLEHRIPELLCEFESTNAGVPRDHLKGDA
jgi:ParB family transcriptional regulator, chromosome partitioning protein